MTKAQDYSRQRLQWAIEIIRELAPQEMQRESKERRRKLVDAFELLQCHARKMTIEVPKLSNFYHPEQYLAAADQVAEELG